MSKKRNHRRNTLEHYQASTPDIVPELHTQLGWIWQTYWKSHKGGSFHQSMWMGLRVLRFKTHKGSRECAKGYNSAKSSLQPAVGLLLLLHTKGQRLKTLFKCLLTKLFLHIHLKKPTNHQTWFKIFQILSSILRVCPYFCSPLYVPATRFRNPRGTKAVLKLKKHLHRVIFS